MSVWKTLSLIDVNDHTTKKGKFTYLSWTWAWATLMKHYPESTYEFLPNEIHADDSVTVHCKVTVEGVSHTMWLAVMDNKNSAIKNPSARDIGDQKMRCLTKALAMFGLGFYIYAGESVPEADLYDELHLVLNSGSPQDLLEHLAVLSDEQKVEAYNGAPKGQKTQFKELVSKMETEAHAELDAITGDLTTCIYDKDKHGVDEIWDECSKLQKKLIGARLTEQLQEEFKSIRLGE